jgi:2-phospho-L-lactate transferase/gluconeogenesis factor (CofD/UPF0052 family)
VVGLEVLSRFCDETGSVAGGDVRAQLEAWDVDHDEFFQFLSAWANTTAIRMGTEPYPLALAGFAFFELGYRSALEVVMSDES